MRPAVVAALLVLAVGNAAHAEGSPIGTWRSEGGKATVRMVYRRPWESVPPVEVVVYEVDVR